MEKEGRGWAGLGVRERARRVVCVSEEKNSLHSKRTAPGSIWLSDHFSRRPDPSRDAPRSRSCLVCGVGVAGV